MIDQYLFTSFGIPRADRLDPVYARQLAELFHESRAIDRGASSYLAFGRYDEARRASDERIRRVRGPALLPMHSAWAGRYLHAADCVNCREPVFSPYHESKDGWALYHDCGWRPDPNRYYWDSVRTLTKAGRNILNSAGRRVAL